MRLLPLPLAAVLLAVPCPLQRHSWASAPGVGGAGAMGRGGVRKFPGTCGSSGATWERHLLSRTGRGREEGWRLLVCPFVQKRGGEAAPPGLSTRDALAPPRGGSWHTSAPKERAVQAVLGGAQLSLQARPQLDSCTGQEVGQTPVLLQAAPWEPGLPAQPRGAWSLHLFRGLHHDGWGEDKSASVQHAGPWAWQPVCAPEC